MDVGREIKKLEDFILIRERDNERKLDLTLKRRHYEKLKEEVTSYLKETTQTVTFLSKLNSKLIDNNKEFIEKEIDNYIERFFPYDNFNSFINIDVDKKGRYLASLLLGKDKKDYNDLEFQNGDFIQQLALFSVYDTLLSANKGKIFFIDEGFSNIDASREEELAKMIDGMKIKYKIMIEHRPKLIANMDNVNVIKLKRDLKTNTVKVVK